MPTKSASRRYRHTKGARYGLRTIHIGYEWARAFNKKTLKDHFSRHGKQMDCTTAEEYNAKAVSFANTINKEKYESFVAKNGSTYKYDASTNRLAVISKFGIVVTYYKPDDGRAYYLKEKEKREDKKHNDR